MSGQFSKSDVFLLAKKRINNLLLLVLNNLKLYDFEVNSVDEDDNTLLHISVLKGNIPIVKKLVEIGADINAFNKNGESPISLACTTGQLNMIKIMVPHDMPKIFTQAQKSLIQIAYTHNHFDIVKYFVKNNVPSNEELEKLLKNCIMLNDIHMIACLLKWTQNKIKIESILDHKSRNLIQIGILNLNYRIITASLTEGIDVNHQDAEGNTPLHYCVKINSVKVLKEVLHHKPEINRPNLENYTALHDSVRIEKDIEILLTLLAYGADVSCKTNRGDTVLHLAASHGNVPAVTVLLPLISRDILNKDLHTALDLARLDGHEVIVRLLLDSSEVNTESQSDFKQDLLI